MHLSELKETIEQKVKEILDTSYVYESNYGLIAEKTFLYIKPVMLINTEEKRIEGENHLALVIDNPDKLKELPADKIANRLICVRAVPEVWLDDVIVQDGCALKNMIGHRTIVALIYDHNYHIKKDIKQYLHKD